MSDIKHLIVLNVAYMLCSTSLMCIFIVQVLKLTQKIKTLIKTELIIPSVISSSGSRINLQEAECNNKLKDFFLKGRINRFLDNVR